MANRLMSEKSPYLIQHSNNPVDWYPWGEEAFCKAEKEDKPVLVSIGYSTCHWCHVMAHESFEDYEVAKLLNRDYVCIKVDREERPDIDAVYMAVCQAMTGAGGWPLTIFMTAQQQPFFAGAYFPKKSRYGQTGMMELLQRITELWRSDRERLLTIGKRVTELLSKPEKGSATDFVAKEYEELLEKAYAIYKNAFSVKWGGFGSAPKFPAPHNLMLLMNYCNGHKRSENESPNAMAMVEKTLDAMARGGIFDHIGGGFSRYSTDERWLIPHFEKMLYDNALLIIAYTAAYQLTGKRFYADISRRTANYILRELTDGDGGFYCGQDADSDGVEGGYYVFTMDELQSALGEDAAEFCKRYGISSKPNFEGGSVPNRIGIDEECWAEDDPRIAKLYRYRKERTSLHKDDKILLEWNGWAITALAYAGHALEEPRMIKAAIKAQRFIEEKMRDGESRLYHRFRDGEAAYTGQLNDYAAYCLSLLTLYRATFDAEYLQLAVKYANVIIELFEDSEQGGYFIYAHDAEQLIARPKETYDGAIPSGNSVTAMALVELAALTGEERLRSAAQKQLDFIAKQSAEYPAGYSFGLLSIAKRLYTHSELTCCSNKAPGELREYLQKNAAFGLSAIYKSDANAELLATVAPFTAAYPVPQDGAMWYLCKDGACYPPVSDFSKLEI